MAKEILPANVEGLQKGHQKGNLMVVVLEVVEEVEVEAAVGVEYGETNYDDCWVAVELVDLNDLCWASHQVYGLQGH